ncbi:phosphotransferase [Posidoniimonas polymericola]|uniref:phosphotransferase n=1 Tax=Posidoniimonas polymericola TaxID=2528002 RepID=UPI0018D3C5E1|nr:phosphotransferase [Posidoniimonas polymericola]
MRYKPGASCLASLSVADAAGPPDAYAIAFADSHAEKLANIVDRAEVGQCDIDRESNIVVWRAPFDRRLPSLAKLVDVGSGLLGRLLPEAFDDRPVQLAGLRYKPERRFVARIDRGDSAAAVVKLYSQQGYQTAWRASKSLAGLPTASRQCPVGHSSRHGAIAYDWAPGVAITDWRAAAADAGPAVAALHGARAGKLPELTAATLIARLKPIAASLRWLVPQAGDAIDAAAARIAAMVAEVKPRRAVLHGDLHTEQFLAAEHGVNLIDFDRACLGPPEWDLANLRTDLWERVHGADGDSAWSAFLEAYRRVAPADTEAIAAFSAVRLFEQAINPFRLRHASWQEQLVARVADARRIVEPGRTCGVVSPRQPVPEDERLPWLAEACDPTTVSDAVAELLPGLAIDAAKLVRHKPGRRGIVYYQAASGAEGQASQIVGKTERKPRHHQRLKLQRLLWEADFHDQSADGVSVARPMGGLPQWNMWLQSHVEGLGGWGALDGDDAPAAARHAARAIAKLHATSLLVDKKHGFAEEAEILSDRLGEAASMAPELSRRIRRVRDHCLEMLAAQPAANSVLLHRDFYPDQLIYGEGRVTLLDLDLVCHGPAAIDVGNFTGHLVEMAIRTGNPARYDAVESAFVGEYLQTANSASPKAIEATKLATLARHLYISQTRKQRRQFTSDILANCERMMADRER